MNTFVIAYSSPYHVVIPDKYINTEEDSYKLVLADLPSPELKGFAFAGWFLDDKFTTQAHVNTVITGNTTLYAKWTETEVSIITGIGKYQFRLKRELTAENLAVDDPNTETKLTLVAGNVLTGNGTSADELVDGIDDKIAAVQSYINVHDHGY